MFKWRFLIHIFLLWSNCCVLCSICYGKIVWLYMSSYHCIIYIGIIQISLIFIPPANCLSGPTSTSFVRFPPSFVEFKIMMCELCSIKDFIVHWILPLLCLFGLGNFETIQYSLCHRKFSYMINQKFMKLCTLQDPNMKMCTLVVYPGPSSFPRIMSKSCVPNMFWLN